MFSDAPPPRDLIVMIEPSIAGLKNDSPLALTWSPPFASAQPMLPVNYTYEVYWNAIYEKDGMPDSLRYFGPKTYETKNVSVVSKLYSRVVHCDL